MLGMGRSSSLEDMDGLSPRHNSTFSSMEITLSKRSMDALGLVIGAGFSKTVEVCLV